MKKLVFAMLVITFVGTACSKDADKPNDVVGKWQWTMSVGGMTGKDTLRPPANTTVYLFLNANGSYQKTSNGQQSAEGYYSIVSVKSIFSGQMQSSIKFDNSVGDERLIGWDNGRLILTDNHTEPYAAIYTRVN
ncbi:hypothetical protein [Sediminibacterium soli]|uniref:hypothetical protein n=1 Tax=Sediminibacterium soli TaxID=2698829 RepID=UPI001379E8AC|nr:hypothetical protein [Sediminibacterium soli]NCI46196.1 hypothetical protein [Sediminibacterium soli]